MPKLLKEIFIQEEHLQFLKERGYSLDSILDKPDPATESTVLHDAVLYGRTDIVEVLAEHEIDLDQYDEHRDPTRFGYTPLLLAVYWGDKDMVEFLIDKKVNIHKCQRDRGDSPLMLSVLRKRKEIMVLLINKGANINQENSKDVLIWINSTRYPCPTALMYAADRQDKQFMRILIEKGSKRKNSKKIYFLNCCHNSAAMEEMRKFMNSLPKKNKKKKVPALQQSSPERERPGMKKNQAPSFSETDLKTLGQTTQHPSKNFPPLNKKDSDRKLENLRETTSSLTKAFLSIDKFPAFAAAEKEMKIQERESKTPEISKAQSKQSSKKVTVLQKIDGHGRASNMGMYSKDKTKKESQQVKQPTHDMLSGRFRLSPSSLGKVV
jgi:hypothetical protein